MTIILIAAGFFALGLVMIVLFRSAVRADDDLERRWVEAVHNRREASARGTGAADRSTAGESTDAATGDEDDTEEASPSEGPR